VIPAAIARKAPVAAHLRRRKLQLLSAGGVVP
jgi:hypothetical protein